MKTIAVLGTGYVGLTTAALFAQAGYKVFAVEPNNDRLSVIKQGRSFFFEEGLDPIIKAGIDSGNLVATDSYEEAVPSADIVFSSVGTPDNPDGSSNLTYVFGAATEAAKHMKPGAIYIQKSTVPVGTGEKVEKIFKEASKEFPYVSNPEFLRESTAVSDTLYFDRVVAGGNDPVAVEAVLNAYRDLEAHRDEIAKLANIEPIDQVGDYIATSRNSAELIKVTANAFLALKISFANSIAKLADQADADVTEVMAAVGADKRINKAFFNAGRGYGGGCFPKDVSGLIASGLDYGVHFEIMRAVRAVNDSMPGYIAEKMKDAFADKTLRNKKVAVLGLAFKAGTSDARRSPGVMLADLLESNGADVTAYDPEAIEEAGHELDEDVTLVHSFDEAVKDVDAILIATDWKEFVEKPLSDYRAAVKEGTLFVDGLNKFSSKEVTEAGLKYIGVGRR